MMWMCGYPDAARLSAGALEFGHFHCRVAASEGRPAFQGRTQQPNPIPRRRATDEIANPTGCEIQAPLTRRGFPTGYQRTGLERPAYRQAPRCGGEPPLRETRRGSQVLMEHSNLRQFN